MIYMLKLVFLIALTPGLQIAPRATQADTPIWVDHTPPFAVQGDDAYRFGLMRDLQAEQTRLFILCAKLHRHAVQEEWWAGVTNCGELAPWFCRTRARCFRAWETDVTERAYIFWLAEAALRQHEAFLLHNKEFVRERNAEARLSDLLQRLGPVSYLTGQMPEAQPWEGQFDEELAPEFNDDDG